MLRKLTCMLALAVLVAAPALAAESATKEKKVETQDRLFVIETNFGRIVIEPMPAIAPHHVERFFTLANRGFYNGCTFHRVIPGFMIQGGDPNSKDDNLANDGTGDSDLPNVKAEFSNVKHVPGIVSTARTQDPNSANCQFFIMTGTAPYLDGKYTVWGKVIEGMNVVDQIVNLPRNAQDNPGKAAVMKKVYTAPRDEVLKKKDADAKK